MTTLEFEGSPTFTLAFDRVSGGSGSSDWIMATEAEALAGTSNSVVMSPLRVDQAIEQNNAALGPIVADEVDNALTPAAVQAKLYFFDKAGDLLLVTIPAGTDVIYRLGYAQRGDHEITRFRRKADTPTTAPTNNLAWEKDASGVFFINDMPEIDARTFGLKGGARTVATAGMTAGSPNLGATGASFTTADIGRRVSVLGCGTLDATYNKDSQLDAIIVSITNVNNCVLNTSAATTASGQYLVVYADDTVPLINACRAAATLGRWATLPPGDFATTGSVTGVVGYSYFRLKGAGMTATRIIHTALAHVGTAETQFAITGGLPAGPYLTTPASAGTNTIVVNSVTGLAVGNILAITAKDKPWPANDIPGSAAGYEGDVARIRSIDVPSKTILLEDALLYNYTANPVVELQSAVNRCDVGHEPSLRDICLEHSSPSGNAATAHVAFSRVLKPRVENVLFRHTGANAIALHFWIDGAVDQCTFSHQGGPDALDDFWGYGIQVDGPCWNVRINDCIGWRCRHAFTSGGGNSNLGPHFIHVSNFTAYGCRISFDTHSGGRFFTFENCHSGPGTVVLNTPVPGSHGVGFQMRALDTKLIGCTVAGTETGIMFAYTPNGLAQNCHVEDVFKGAVIVNSPGTQFVDCSFRNYATLGISAYIQNGDSIPTMPNLKFKGLTFWGNPTRQELLDTESTLCYEPVTFQLGLWQTAGPTFFSAYEDSWTFEDITIHDSHNRWKGLPETGTVYGALKQNTVIAESVPLDEINGTASLTSGTALMAAIDLPKGTYVAKLGTIFATVPVGQTNLWFSIWDWNLNFLGSTADALTTAPTASVLTMQDVTTPFCINHPGRHYIGIHQAAGTSSTVNSKTLPVALIGLNPKRSGTSNTGLTTPASLPSISAATSATSLPIQLGIMTFTTQSGKAFTKAMPILIASNATPTNLMRARVATYSGTTLNVEVYETGGSGTYNDWDITAKAKATALTATSGWFYAAVG